MASDTGVDYIGECLKYADPYGLFLEFGVADGGSIRRLARYVPGIIYGFDWFQGLPEEWTGKYGMPKGSFRCDPPKDLPANVKIVNGLFQDTLPGFLKEHPEKVSFVHIDCDLYSSTLFVLSSLSDRLNGTIVAFDEIFLVPCYVEHEGTALAEFLSETGYTAELIGKQHECGGVFKIC